MAFPYIRVGYLPTHVKVVIVAVVLCVSDCTYANDQLKGAATDASTTIDLKDQSLVVWLGGTFVERAQRYGHLETALTAWYPKRKIAFRNLGWSGDTVWAESRGIFDKPAVGYKRMVEQLGELKPDLTLIQYGANESFAGEQGYGAFREQLDQLLDDLGATGSELALISPHRFETPGPPLPDATVAHPNLKMYSSGLSQESQQRGIPFVDLFTKYTSSNRLTDNGIHFTDQGYKRIAEVFLDRCGIEYEPELIAVRAAGKVLPRGFKFKSKAKRLPWSGQTLKVSGLPSGMYRLEIDGVLIATAKAEEFTDGIKITNGPDQKQLEKLRQSIVKKNRLYFYRWRPQNITYLFGFRKHEQGNNAKDVAEFEPLVKAVEEDIQRLKMPAEREFSITATGGQK